MLPEQYDCEMTDGCINMKLYTISANRKNKECSYNTREWRDKPIHQIGFIKASGEVQTQGMQVRKRLKGIRELILKYTFMFLCVNVCIYSQEF